MTEATGSTVLRDLFERWARGERAALDALMTELYQEVHLMAVRQLRHERHVTFQPTALVHEVYLRLSILVNMSVRDRSHFLSLAARVARQALVDEARRRHRDKRDGGSQVTLSDTRLGVHGQTYDVLNVDELLTRLQGIDPLAADVITLRVFGGLEITEVAEVLDTSVATVNRRWATGKAWLSWELQKT
jgi:RNA polymerase sigma factor (TIGR02999 family)